jgi:hypothetical protein
MQGSRESEGGTVNKPSQANKAEYGDLARALDQLAEQAPTMAPTELVEFWPGLESRVLACLRADEGADPARGAGAESRLRPSDDERLRNLAWEIGVSVDLHAVHLGAMRALAKVLRERSQRLGSRVTGASYAI